MSETPEITAEELDQLLESVEYIPPLQRIEELEAEVSELNELFKSFNSLVYDQKEDLGLLEDHIEDASINVEEAKEELEIAVKYSRYSYPVIGAVVGGALFGPVGALAGAKSGALIGCLSATGVVSGYIVGKKLS